MRSICHCPLSTGWLVLLALAVGCSKPASKHPTARLEGRVLIDGTPIASGSLQFLPKQSGQPDSATLTEGHYVAERVPIGSVKVLFTAIKETGKTIHEGGHSFPERVSLIPAKFSGGIDIEVQGDNSAQDFALNSR